MDTEYRCSEGHLLKILTCKKEGANQGRDFIAGNECGAFHWLENYSGNAPKCRPKKDFVPTKQKSPEPAIKKLPVGSPHSQKAIIRSTDQAKLAEHKAKDLIDMADQFQTGEEMMAWYFEIARIMNEYFLSKVNAKLNE